MSNLVNWPMGDVAKLKPCPFCGWSKPVVQEAAIDDESDEVVGPAYVQCLECGCVGPFTIEEAEDEVSAWNTRVNADTGGMRLGIVDNTLGTWRCRMNDDAVDCGHMYCREHALCALIRELRGGA